MDARNKMTANPDIASELAHRVDKLRREAPFQNYLRVRENVLAAMDLSRGSASTPSKYWQEELAGFEYMLDASPLVIDKLREHCFHITGIKSYDYRGHHAHAAQPFAAKLAMLRAVDSGDLFVPENPSLGGFGHTIDGNLVNIDTLKFYESLIAIERGGLLKTVRSQPNRNQVWVEIGAGWGGFGYVVKTIFPQVTYVIVDLPQTLLFSATYLMSVFPELRCAIYPQDSLEECTTNLHNYDFVFLPHFVFPDLKLPIDLAVNMISFQEMTTQQVTSYVRHLAGMGCSRLYSHNRDRSGHNTELTGVTSIIAENFATPREVEVLGFAYTSLTPPVISKDKKEKKGGWMSPFWGKDAKAKPGKTPKPSKTIELPTREHRKPTAYRHLIAERD